MNEEHRWNLTRMLKETERCSISRRKEMNKEHPWKELWEKRLLGKQIGENINTGHSMFIKKCPVCTKVFTSCNKDFVFEVCPKCLEVKAYE